MNSPPDLPKPGPARRVFWVAGLTAAAALALAPLSFHVERRLDTAVRLEGSESDYVAQPLASRFCSPATFLALFAGFRSLFAAAKAVALNLLSVGAACGAMVLVFQEGHGNRWLGVPQGTSGVFPIVPILAFAIVFGLSMDYEVFLVARVLEARRSERSETEAITEGLARTAGLITSAAAIMIIVFAGFTLGDFLVIKMLGFTLAVAVLIDATLVRIVIGPALLSLAGDWNWWPGGLAGANVRGAPERIR